MSESFLVSTRRIFRAIQTTGAGALAQLSLDEMQRPLGEEQNSVAVLVQHLHGNMLSRWTDFLTTDGEKTSRDRDGEFIQRAFQSREEILALWDEGWACTLRALDALQISDLERTITIRGQAHTVIDAIHRQIQHYSYHIGQIVLIARWMKGPAWKSLSIAPGQSRSYKPTGIGGEPGVAK